MEVEARMEDIRTKADQKLKAVMGVVQKEMKEILQFAIESAKQEL
jgi:hypothetical protein